MSRRAHVIGAGLSGLSAAVTLVQNGVKVAGAEAAPQAGGRCRSYYDPHISLTIDNGNHLVLSGAKAVAAYLATIGATNRLSGPDEACFCFVDRHSGERWQFRPNHGRIPWWILSPERRVPRTSARNYIRFARLMTASPRETVADRIEPNGRVWKQLLEPVLLAALNTSPKDADATLTAAVIRQSIGKGGQAMQPRVPIPNLSSAFVDPAVEWLERNGSTLGLGMRLRELVFQGDYVVGLDFGTKFRPVAAREPVVLAVPPWVAGNLVPNLTVPDEFRAIVNGHFAVVPPHDMARITALINGDAEWIFAFADRISVTVSAAERMVDQDRAALAAKFWADVAAVHNLPGPMPTWQIVKEKRATFAATPAQEAKRPAAGTRWRNLFLAGDWTATGLPATIEGALRSGTTAAQLAVASC